MADGPGADMFESTRIIGEKQLAFARALAAGAAEAVTGGLDYVHTYVDVPNLVVQRPTPLVPPGEPDGALRESRARPKCYHNAGCLSDAELKRLHAFTVAEAARNASNPPKPVRLCKGAMGFSFAAGTTDGPGAFNFVQGSNGSASRFPLWDRVRDLLHAPSAELIACQTPKPVLLATGETNAPYPPVNFFRGTLFQIERRCIAHGYGPGPSFPLRALAVP